VVQWRGKHLEEGVERSICETSCRDLSIGKNCLPFCLFENMGAMIFVVSVAVGCLSPREHLYNFLFLTDWALWPVPIQN
jgi:hypothetical protein